MSEENGNEEPIVDELAQPCPDEQLMFNDLERKYIANVLKKSSLNQNQKVSVINRLLFNWFHSDSVANGKGMDPFIWLPVMTEMYVKQVNNYKYYGYNELSDFQKVSFNNFQNPLEKHLFAWFRQTKDCYIDNVLSYIINNKLPYSRNVLYTNLIKADLMENFKNRYSVDTNGIIRFSGHRKIFESERDRRMN